MMRGNRHRRQRRRRRRSTDLDFLLGITLACGHPIAVIADRLIIVTTPEPTALADGRATPMALVCRGFIGRPGVVRNVARLRDERLDFADPTERATRRVFGRSLENLGCIPHVPAAVRVRMPGVLRNPRCPASLSLERISGILAGRPGAAGPRAGLWSRVAGPFR